MSVTVRAAVGTAAQLHQATGIPVSTIHLYARQGALNVVDRVLVGNRRCARYDGDELMRILIERLKTRRNVGKGGSPRDQ